jgi:hypothetical protein
MGVPALEKAPGIRCGHCEMGCSIYASRPEVCRTFLCGYLTDATIDDVWKPSRCNFALVPRYEQNCIVVMVDPDYPDAWKQEPYYTALVRLARKGAPHGGKVYVSVGDTKITLNPNM